MNSQAVKNGLLNFQFCEFHHRALPLMGVSSETLALYKTLTYLSLTLACCCMLNCDARACLAFVTDVLLCRLLSVLGLVVRSQQSYCQTYAFTSRLLLRRRRRTGNSSCMP